MSIIYVDEQGASIRKEGQAIVVSKDGALIGELPLSQLDRICIVGNVQISTPVFSFLLDNGIPVSFVSTGGRYRGELTPGGSKNVVLRLAQFRKSQDTEFCLALSTTIVTSKIRNFRELLLRHRRNHPQVPLEEEIDRLSALVKSCLSATDLDQLRGCEGAASRTYFGALGKMVRREFSFEKRSRRPPRDPVNSLLSLGYTLLCSDIVSALSASGFDPFLGFYHKPEYGRPSLAVDMMEEFRYLIDGLALTLINKAMLAVTDFEEVEGGGCYLTKPARKMFYHRYESRIREKVKYDPTGEAVNYRRVFFYQAQNLARCLTSDAEYKPFLIR